MKKITLQCLIWMSGLLLNAVFFDASAAPGTNAEAGDNAIWQYKVRSGDTLINVSQRYLKNPQQWPALQVINKLSDPNKLLPGEPLRIPLAMLKQRMAFAEVIAVSGSVQVLETNSTARVLQVGNQLGAGAEIQVSNNSSATLRFADGSIVVMQPSSSMRLDRVSVYADGVMVDTGLRLHQGRIEVTANPRHGSKNRMQITTPSAVAAVRGTQFRVSVEQDITREETLEGSVGLSAANKEFAVERGYGSLAKRGQPPKPPIALLAEPNVSALPTFLDRLPMRFELPMQSGAVSWFGQIAPNKSFDHVLLEKVNTSPRLSFADLPDGKYLLRVRAVDVNGLQGKDALHAFELDARPFPPLVLAPPQAGTVRMALPEIHWSEMTDVQAYRVELARDGEFKDKLLQATVAERKIKLDKPLEPGNYFLRIASISSNDQGPFQETIKFTFKPLPKVSEVAQSAITFDGNQMSLALPKPAEGLIYDIAITADKERSQINWQGKSQEGNVRLPTPPAGKQFLSIRMVEADGTAGPFATQAIDVPNPRWKMLLLAIPLLAL